MTQGLGGAPSPGNRTGAEFATLSPLGEIGRGTAANENRTTGRGNRVSSAESEYSIQEASERLGIPIQKLRRWDEQGVLTALRTSGGHRRYAKELINRLAASAGGTVNLEVEKTSQELATVKRSLAEKRRIIQLLLESENRYRDLVETSHDLIWATDAQGRFIYLNNAAHEIFGLKPSDLIGRCFFDFESGPSHISNRRFFATLVKNGEVKNYVTHLVTNWGEDRWIGINARITHDENGDMLGIRGTARDITEQHLATQKIEHLALHDALTELPNRHSLQTRVEQAIEEGGLGALLFLDLDHFKYVNDNFGHRFGDELLIGVGSALLDLTRTSGGELFRLGGDEFAIHLPGELRERAVQAAELALDAIRHFRFKTSDHKTISNLAASMGIALYPFHGADLPTLLSNVDISMYQAKDLGRNRYMLYDQSSESLRTTHRRIHWAKKLRDALDEDRLVLFSQPVVRLRDKQTIHHEILVRIRDDDGGYILPSNFIKIAESLGLVQEIDLRVLEKLLKFMRDNKQMGKKLRYFVNLSRVSISDEHWVKRCMAAMRASRVDPSQLVFEITETAAMSEIDVTLNFIKKMKALGCRFALDDFGAGFSSFYYLKRLDVDYLKIDGGFIRDLATDEGSRLFVKALSDIAAGLKKQVIAEWVETPEVLKILLSMGVQFGQGFLFQHPEPLEKQIETPAAARRRA